jgi:alkanesulfonate monooxygenase SsuD/methylene tetrahydromethanopterin reductase-like flavin-dependent oxidoreductase (luciferase family)
VHVGMLGIFQNYKEELGDDRNVMEGELALAKLAEAGGFDSYWAPEHHFYNYSMCPDNVQWLAQVAAVTEQIKLGTGAVIMPWNDPYRVAAKIAMLDQQSGGRVLLGFGRGLSRREYEGFNLPMDEARRRFDEGVPLVIDALNTGFFEADTTYFKQPRRELRPRPTRGFEDRVYSIGVSPESAVQAAVVRAQLMVLAQQPWEVFKQNALIPYQKRWTELHGGTAPVPMAGMLVYCDKDPVKAKELGSQFVREYFMTVVEHYEIGGDHFKDSKGYEHYANAATAIEAMGLDAMADIYGSLNPVGTPEEIVEIIQAQRDVLGLNHDVLFIPRYGSMSLEQAETSVKLLADEVIPKLR